MRVWKTPFVLFTCIFISVAQSSHVARVEGPRVRWLVRPRAADLAPHAAGLDLAEFTRLVRDVVAWQETQTARNLASDAKCRAAFGKVDADQSGRLTT